MMSSVIRHLEHFEQVGSTNDVVRGWLETGRPEVCVAVAREQTAGRGRDGRAWVAPPGTGLLMSMGFRPAWSAPERVWRLAAITALAMADAAEDLAGLEAGTIRCKWPNDLVIEAPTGLRKLAGVLGETDGLGSGDPRTVVGIGVDVDWPADRFPPELAATMTSLSELSGRRITPKRLADAMLTRLSERLEALREDRFDAALWAARQATTGRSIRLQGPDGSDREVRAMGVDPDSGALLVEGSPGPGTVTSVFVGEVRHVRVLDPVAAGV